MKPDDEFAAWMAGAALRSAGEPVQAIFLDDVVAHAGPNDDLNTLIARSGAADRRPGDFGMEIIGPLIVSVLIEAGKQLWTAYTKKLTDKAADQLAGATVDTIKAALRSRASDADRAGMVDELAGLVKTVGKKHDLTPEQIGKLVEAIQSPAFADAIRAG